MNNSTVEARFMRPSDLRAIRRNHRQVQVQRLLWIAANGVLALSLLLAGYWLFDRTQSDSRFSVRKIQIVGAQYTAADALQKIHRRYNGTNLFRLDVLQLRRELDALPWVERAEIEKQIPDTLVIRVVERRPVALLGGTAPHYLDREGKAFAPLSRTVGDPDLPLVNGESAQDIRRCVDFLHELRATEPALYSRVSEVSPLVPEGFRVFDRDLRTWISVDGAGSRRKWVALYDIVQREGFAAGEVQYADLRFDRRIVVRPKELPELAPVISAVPTGITN